MKETYKFEFQQYNFSCDNFKQKQALIIINTIAGSRLNNDMIFSGYGHIEFEETDTKNRYPIVSYIDVYNRNKANCLIYDLKNTKKNQGYYDKCFIYHTIGSKEGNYGYVLYNSKTGDLSHKYFIDHEYDTLCIKLTESFNLLYKLPIIKYYIDIHNKIKNLKNNQEVKFMSEAEFNKCWEEQLNKYI